MVQIELMDRVDSFNQQRSLLFSISYRMLGSVVEAEDILQEAFIRWQQTTNIEEGSSRAYLSTIVTRLCIDHLKSARARREEYVGPWLPEPLLTETSPDPADMTTLNESLSMAFLIMLESLSPVERAVFVLREVFDYDYAEISHVVGKSESNCRQIARRARRAAAARRPRFESSSEERKRITERFVEACASGELSGLLSLLEEDVVLYADGGGEVSAARNPIFGADRVARYLLGLLRKRSHDPETTYTVRREQINGQPGLVAYAGRQPASVLTLEAAGGNIRTIHIVLNPDKLRSLPPLP